MTPIRTSPRLLMVVLLLVSAAQLLPSRAAFAACPSSSTGPAARCGGSPPIAQCSPARRVPGKPQAPPSRSKPDTDSRTLKRLQDLRPRLDAYLQHCRTQAEQATADEQAANRKIAEHERAVSRSLQELLLLQELLATNSNSLEIAGKGFSQEQVGGFLAGRLSDHRRLLEQSRELRLDAAAAAARRRGADQQVARWQQQRAELLSEVQSLIRESRLPTVDSTARTTTAARLAADLESSLPPLDPAPSP